MDVPVSIAIGGAFLASVYATIVDGTDVYFDSVCMFTFFLLSSRYLEMGARHRAGQAAEALVKLLPATATRVEADGERVVAVADLVPGDLVLVRPGETVPADGVLVEGRSSVDESLLTGESLPRPKAAGEELIGGSVNVESPLRMQVERVGDDTMVSAIVRLLDRAQAEKPRLARVADRVAGWFVAALLLVATAVATWWSLYEPARAFAVTLSVLVVTCPCALSLATPTAVAAAVGALTRLGLLITRGHTLETLARATCVVFDKTGTLTLGMLRLVRTRMLGDLDEARALAIAAALERSSEHPVAKVLVAAAGERLEARDVESTPGFGIEGVIDGRRYRVGGPAYAAALAGVTEPDVAGDGATVIFLADERQLLAAFELRDTLRSDAAEAVAKLREQGLRPIILSGDAAAAVAKVAGELGIEDARAGLKPDDKLAVVRELQRNGERVVMVGDGVNDAPVLAGADISVAMGTGAQLAHATADMVMLSERLGALPQGVAGARRTLKVIKQNLTWALSYNLVALPLAAAGMVAPWMAAIGMSMSSLVVVFNALRLRRVE
jgi:Cu2+-exporting ATPase